MMPKLLPPVRLYCFKKSDLNLIRSSVIHVTCTRVGICRLKGVEVFAYMEQRGRGRRFDSTYPVVIGGVYVSDMVLKSTIRQGAKVKRFENTKDVQIK